jgi:hypothetical protein
MNKHITGSFLSIASYILALFFIVCGSMLGQMNPAPQSLPYTQNFGTTSFSVLPAGFAAWKGMSGATTLSQAAAEASVPNADASVTAATGKQSPGGVYGYASNGNAMIYLQGSGNTTNGVNQLMMAINTKGTSSIKVNYTITMLFTSITSAYIVLQCRVGSTGPWTTVANSIYPANGSKPATDEVSAYTDLQLPSSMLDKDTVQLRWAFWRGTEGSTTSGIGIDDIAIFSGTGTSAPDAPTLASLADNAVNQPLSLQLSWNAASSATTYRLQIASNNTFTPVLMDSANIPGLSLNVTRLENNRMYYWRASASNAVGSSMFSETRTFSTIWTITPATPVAIAPASLSVGAVVNALVFKWNGAAGALTYHYQIAADSQFAVLVADDSTTSLQTQVKALKGDMTYWWRVQAKNNAGTSAYTAPCSFTTARVYQIPQQVLFSSLTGQTLVDSVTTNYTAVTVLDYNAAREKIYGEIDKVGDTLKCVYTGFACYMPPGVSALTAASNGTINAEHSFPQSVGAGTGNANSDMHHIYATNGTVNSARSNWPYGEIPDANVIAWYRLSSITGTKPAIDVSEYSKSGATSFEPRDAHKGHVARAIFYFYTIYKAQASVSFFEGMKATLLKWNSKFPVDSSEYARTMKIAVYQSGKANPFILDTSLVRRIYNTVTGVTATSSVLPAAFKLEQNYPNPFNPTTSIGYTIPDAGTVTLRVYDVLGRMVSTVVNEMKSPGSYSVGWDASNLSSGMYFYRLEAGKYTATKKLVVQK